MTSEFEKNMRWFDEFFLWTLAGLHDLTTDGDEIENIWIKSKILLNVI